MRKLMGYRAQARRYNYLTAHLATAARKEAIDNAITELLQMHSQLHRDCLDEGENTCPTWSAVYGLRRLRGLP